MKNHEGVLAMKRMMYKYFSTLDYFEVMNFIFISNIKLNLFIEFI